MKKRPIAAPLNGLIHAALVAAIMAVLVIAMLVSLAALGQEPAATSGGNFEGDWSATGTRQILPASPNKNAVIAYFSGSLILRAPGGLSRGYRAEVIAYDDGRDVSAGTCVWTDEKGDQIYSDLKGQAVGTGKHVKGTITGGTGRYAGITGEFAFDWQYVITTPEGEVQGRVSSLKGWWKRAPSPGAPSSEPVAP